MHPQAMVLVVLSSAAVIASGCGDSASQPEPAAAEEIRVEPQRGGPESVFRVSMPIARGLGRDGGVERHYVVSVRGPAEPGCAVEREVVIGTGAAGSRGEAVLRAAGGGAGTVWCVGSFRGRVIETEAPACPAGGDCPAGETRTLGEFGFEVQR